MGPELAIEPTNYHKEEVMKAKDLRPGQAFTIFHMTGAGVFVRMDRLHDSEEKVAATQRTEKRRAYFLVSADTEVSPVTN